MKYLKYIIFLLLQSTYLFSQSIDDYNRSAISFVLIKDGKGGLYSKCYSLFSSTKVNLPDKFDDNRFIEDKLEIGNFEQFNEVLLAKKIPNKIINSLFSENDGKLSTSLLEKRILYSLTDNDVEQFKKSFGGTDLNSNRKYFEKLLNSNYILSFKVDDIITYEQYYNRKDEERRKEVERLRSKGIQVEFNPVERIYQGYLCQSHVELYKIVFNDSVISNFYQYGWSDQNSDPNKVASASAFRQNANYLLKKEFSGNMQLSGNNFIKEDRLSDEQYLSMMINSIGIPTIEAFILKAKIFNIYPISMKIGKKESIGVDSRFIVYDKKLDSKNEEIIVRVGTVRGKKIIDNRNISSGNTEPSTFYQTSGKKIDKGMTSKEEPKYANIYLGVGSNLLYLKSDIFFGTIYKEFAIPALKFYIDLYGIESKSFSAPNDKVTINGKDEKTNVNILGFGFGFAKEFYFMRNFLVAPYLGLQLESASFSSEALKKEINSGNITINNKKVKEGDYGTAYSYHVGAYLGYNVYKDTRLVFGLGYSPISYDKDLVFGKNSPLYIQRSPIKFNISLCFNI